MDDRRQVLAAIYSKTKPAEYTPPVSNSYALSITNFLKINLEPATCNWQPATILRPHLYLLAVLRNIQSLYFFFAADTQG